MRKWQRCRQRAKSNNEDITTGFRRNHWFLLTFFLRNLSVGLRTSTSNFKRVNFVFTFTSNSRFQVKCLALCSHVELTFLGSDSKPTVTPLKSSFTGKRKNITQQQITSLCVCVFLFIPSYPQRSVTGVRKTLTVRILSTQYLSVTRCPEDDKAC